MVAARWTLGTDWFPVLGGEDGMSFGLPIPDFIPAHRILNFQADPTGATDSSVAIQNSLDRARDDGAGALSNGKTIVFIDAGKFRVDNELLIYPDTILMGAGPESVLWAGPNLPLTSSLIRNANQPAEFGVRQDKGIVIRDLAFDGSGRDYPAYLSNPDTGEPILDPSIDLTRNPGWSTLGYILTLYKTVDALLQNVHLYGHESLGIREMGGINTRILNCHFYNNGKVDNISSPIWVGAAGTPRRILNITNANPGVVTTEAAHGLVPGATVHLEGVLGMNLPDGEYVVGVASGVTFELSGVNTTALGTFSYNPRALMMTDDFTGTEAILVHGCTFRDNLRSGITFGPTRGGTLANNDFTNNGESTIFMARCQDIRIINNRINRTNLKDIAAAGIEGQYLADVRILGNEVMDTAGQCMGIHGTGIQIIGNYLYRPFRDLGLIYPFGPLSERWTLAGGVGGGGTPIAQDPVGDTFKVALTMSNVGPAPLNDVVIAGNVLVEDRDTPHATRGMYFHKVIDNDLVLDIAVVDNIFTRFQIADPALKIDKQGTTVQNHKFHCARNLGHASENPVTIRYLSVGTGIVDFDIGFTPSLVRIEAYQISATTILRSHSMLARTRNEIAAGTLGEGSGFSQGAGGTRSHQLNDDAIRLNDSVGTLINLAEFNGWTDRGFSLNWTTHTSAVWTTITAWP